MPRPITQSGRELSVRDDWGPTERDLGQADDQAGDEPRTEPVSRGSAENTKKRQRKLGKRSPAAQAPSPSPRAGRGTSGFSASVQSSQRHGDTDAIDPNRSCSALASHGLGRPIVRTALGTSRSHPRSRARSRGPRPDWAAPDLVLVSLKALTAPRGSASFGQVLGELG